VLTILLCRAQRRIENPEPHIQILALISRRGKVHVAFELVRAVRIQLCPASSSVCKHPLDCHSEPFAVILSAAKDLALGAQGKRREESRSEHFQRTARFLVA